MTEFRKILEDARVAIEQDKTIDNKTLNSGLTIAELCGTETFLLSKMNESPVECTSDKEAIARLQSIVSSLSEEDKDLVTKTIYMGFIKNLSNKVVEYKSTKTEEETSEEKACDGSCSCRHNIH